MTPFLITLFALALFFAILELFLPGGICGTIGAVLFLIATIVIYGSHGFITAVWTLVGGIVICFLLIVCGIRLIPKTWLGRQVFHTEDATSWLAYDPELQKLVGQTGTAMTTLRPCGTAVIGGHRRDVVTAGEMLPKDTEIVVTEVEGNKIIVQRKAE